MNSCQEAPGPEPGLYRIPLIFWIVWICTGFVLPSKKTFSLQVRMFVVFYMFSVRLKWVPVKRPNGKDCPSHGGGKLRISGCPLKLVGQ